MSKKNPALHIGQTVHKTYRRSRVKSTTDRKLPEANVMDSDLNPRSDGTQVQQRNIEVWIETEVTTKVIYNLSSLEDWYLTQIKRNNEAVTVS